MKKTNQASRPAKVALLACAICVLSGAVASMAATLSRHEKSLEEAPRTAQKMLGEKGHFGEQVEAKGNAFLGYTCKSTIKGVDLVGEARTAWKACVKMAHGADFAIANRIDKKGGSHAAKM